MEIKIKTRHTLRLLNIVAWYLFIGMCIEAGSFFFNAIYTIAVNPEAAGYFRLGELYAYDQGYFLVQILLVSIPGVLKALLFFLIIKILMAKKLNVAQPFNKEMGHFLRNASWISLGIGAFSFWAETYRLWLQQKGIPMPDIQKLNIDGASVWIFMGVILLIIAQLFKRGIEIQSENELTI